MINLVLETLMNGLVKQVRMLDTISYIILGLVQYMCLIYSIQVPLDTSLLSQWAKRRSTEIPPKG